MRTLAPLLIALLVSVTTVAGATAETPSPAPVVEDLTLRFVPLDGAAHAARDGEAVLDIGAISAVAAAAPGKGKGKGRALEVRHRVALRLDSPSGRVTSARLHAALAGELPGCTVRVDGVVLSTVPRLLDPVHRIGTPVVHEIEVVVPPSAPEGLLLGDIEWLAESD